MSKSILVMDNPLCCMECPMCFQSDEISIGKFEYRKLYSCRYAPSDVEDFYLPDILNSKPDWCLLRGLPEKKPRVKYQGDGCFGINEATKNSFNMGFNACIDEILKGANGNE